MALRIAFFDPPEGALPELAPVAGFALAGDLATAQGQDWWLAVSAGPAAADRQFGVGISYSSEDEAVDRARAAQTCDIEAAINERKRFYAALDIPQNVVANLRRAYLKAASIQKVNVESAQEDIPCRWTTPDRMPHRHMWLWDSAFHSIGLSHLEPELAEDAIRAVFAKQEGDGQLHLAVQPGVAPREENTQPPLLAWATWHLAEDEPNIDFLEEVYPRLVSYLEWFEASRRNDTGLYGWSIRRGADAVRGARGGESGMDNSPRFDDLESMTAVDLSCYMAAEYRCLARLARVLHRDDERAEWRARHKNITGLVNDLLWCDEDQFYYDLDEVGEFVRVKTPAGFLPLHAEAPDRDRAEALRLHMMNPKEFWPEFPLPSVSMDEATFGKDMWRGAYLAQHESALSPRPHELRLL